jgi:integrase
LKTARWAHLLEDKDFKRWFDNLARGSRVTAFENARILYRFLKYHDMSPRTLAELGKKDRHKVEDILMDFVAKLHEEGKAPNYISNYLKAVKSWLNYNEVRLIRRIKIGNHNATPTIADERVPTRDELRNIMIYAKPRARCSISLMAFSGLRPESIGNMRGTNGLTVKDFPEMKVDADIVSFIRTPTMIFVQSNLSKAKHKYITFLTNEGCEYLKAYLEMRLADGKELKPESAIISVTPGYEKTSYRSSQNDFITTKNVTREIREAMRPKYMWRPYVLRAYFDTQLLVAENHGKISHAYRQFFMGHKGDIEARYTTNKGRLPESVIEDMRQSYLKCEEYLSTRPVSKEVDPELTAIRTMVESGVLDFTKPKVRAYLIQKLNIKDMEVRIAKIREQGVDEEEANTRVIFGELGIEPIEIQVSKPKSNGDPKKIISERDLEEYLADGWNVQFVLPSGKILVQRDY